MSSAEVIEWMAYFKVQNDIQQEMMAEKKAENEAGNMLNNLKHEVLK
jgi:hypothetical protein